MSTLTLYAYWRSSCSWRVRICAQLLDLPLTIKPVNLLQSQQTATPYTDISPSPLVPLLVVTGSTPITLTQSIAMMRYLSTIPRKRKANEEVDLWPSDAVRQAKVDEIVHVIACDIQPVQNLRVGRKVAKLVVEARGDGDAKGVFADWGHDVIDQGFQVLERLLASSAGTYCVGDHITAADVCLVPQVYNARRFKVDMTKYPTIVRVDEALTALPAFVAAHPDAQPDAVAQ
mmetsp:Transcript_16519/g.51691  ORF Transcript_16519/g.51691 Transcript_16519/m.51691 type:complete len:231 (-) Transcript_16519:27-719(-)